MGDNDSVGGRTTVVSGTNQLANVGDVAQQQQDGGSGGGMGAAFAGQVKANQSILAGGNGRREFIPSSINSSQASSQGSTSNTVVDYFANGGDGGLVKKRPDWAFL